MTGKIPRNFCPILTIGKEEFERCRKSKCAFWNLEAKKCAITAALLSAYTSEPYFTASTYCSTDGFERYADL